MSIVTKQANNTQRDNKSDFNNDNSHITNFDNTKKAFYIGIDIAKYSHTLSIVNQDNQVVLKNKTILNSKKGFSELYADILHYQALGEVHIACEATGHYWLNLFQFLWNKKVDLTVFNPLQVASFRNSRIRGNKTDSDDSVLIARVLKFGVADPRELPNETRFQLKEICRFRHQLKQQSTATKLQIIHILDQVFPEFTMIFKDVDGKTARTVLKTYPNPEELEQVPTQELAELLKTISRNYYKPADAKRLKQKASESIGLRYGMEAFLLQLKILIQQLEHLEDQIQLLDKHIQELVESTQTTLTSIPGISHTIAGTILGECANFKSQGCQSFLAFAGLDPKKRESGNYKGKVKVSKRGSRYLRHALWMAASSARRCSPTFQKVYDKQRGRGKHYNVVIGHVAKKMAYIVDHIMRTNDTFKEQIT